MNARHLLNPALAEYKPANWVLLARLGLVFPAKGRYDNLPLYVSKPNDFNGRQRDSSLGSTPAAAVSPGFFTHWAESIIDGQRE